MIAEKSAQAVQTDQPDGSLVLRTVPMPADTNANGDIFGGWIMSQMDIGGAVLAKEIAGGRVVTVSVDSIIFLKPVAVGDIVCCYAKCTRTGNSSIAIKLEVWVKKILQANQPERYQVTTALFTYVAVDEYNRPRAIAAERRNQQEGINF